jgi:hypothetical protein
MNVKVNVEQVKAEASRQALLTQPDPALANENLLRVPVGGVEGYTVKDWEEAYRFGVNEFTDDYGISHQGQAPSRDDLLKLDQYLRANLLDPMSPQNWKVAWLRLNAAGIIVEELRGMIAAMPTEEPKKLTLAELAKEIEKEMEGIDTRTLEGKKKLAYIHQKYLLIEAKPVYDAFYAELETRGVHLSVDEQKRLIDWIQNHPNLVITQRQTWDKALAAVLPQYLDSEAKALRDLDRDDITSADLKRVLGTAPYRVGSAERRANR